MYRKRKHVLEAIKIQLVEWYTFLLYFLNFGMWYYHDLVLPIMSIKGRRRLLEV